MTRLNAQAPVARTTFPLKLRLKAKRERVQHDRAQVRLSDVQDHLAHEIELRFARRWLKLRRFYRECLEPAWQHVLHEFRTRALESTHHHHQSILSKLLTLKQATTSSELRLPLFEAFELTLISDLRSGANDPSRVEKVLSVVYQVDCSNQRLHDCVRELVTAFELIQFDPRAISCCLQILEEPYMTPEIRFGNRWFDLYTRDHASSLLSTVACRQMLTLVTNSSQEAKVMDQSLDRAFSQTFESPEQPKFINQSQFTQLIQPLLPMLQHLCWSRLTMTPRQTYYREMYLQSIDRTEGIEMEIRLEKALMFWKEMEPRVRFQRWKEYHYIRHQVKRGHDHCVKRSKVLALVQLRVYVGRQLSFRQLNVRAERHYHETLVRTAWDKLMAFYGSEIEIARVSLHRGTIFRRTRVVKDHWTVWHCFYRDEQRRKAHQRHIIQDRWLKRHHDLLERVFRAWLQVNVEWRNDRLASERQLAFERSFAEMKIMEDNVVRMTQEDFLSTSLRQDEWDAQTRAYQSQLDASTRAIHRMRQERSQERAREAAKAEAEAEARAQAADFWSNLTVEAEKSTRSQTLTYLESTTRGKAEVAELAEILYEEDPIDASLKLQKLEKDTGASEPRIMKASTAAEGGGADNVDGCEWQMLLEDFGGMLAKAYFFNSITAQVVMCDDLELKHCRIIAKEMLIQKAVNQMKLELASRAAEAEDLRIANAAARTLQAMFRSHACLKLVRSILRSLWIKRIDADSGLVVYYNLKTRSSHAEPPILMSTRSSQASLAVETSTWCRRRDFDTGDWYYTHLESLEVRWSPPPHHILCVQCRTNFVTRRERESGQRYCIACYADQVSSSWTTKHPREEGEEEPIIREEGRWTKIPVQAAKCIICKTSFAERVCHTCSGDALCRRCFDHVHKIAKFKDHTRVDYIGVDDYPAEE